MADLKISELPNKVTIDGSEEYVINDGGLDAAVTTQVQKDFSTFLTAGLTTNTHISQLSSTGLIKGGALSINVDPTKFNVASGTAVYVDNFTDAANPTIKYVNFASQTGITATQLGVSQISGIYIDEDELIVQRPTIDTTDFRTLVNLGFLQHTAGVVIEVIIESALNPTVSLPNSVADLSIALGAINIQLGNMFGPNGANLQLDKTTGTLFLYGINFRNDPDNPNFSPIASTAAGNFLYIWQNGSGSFNSAFANTINPGAFDDGTGGVGAPNGTVGTSNYTIQRIFLSADGIQIVHYGQATYPNIDDAINNIRSEVFVESPNLSVGSLRSYLVVRGNATDLTNTVQAQFINGPTVGR